jgi:hypothetical protein
LEVFKKHFDVKMRQDFEDKAIEEKSILTMMSQWKNEEYLYQDID